jgi:hypothetical protein
MAIVGPPDEPEVFLNTLRASRSASADHEFDAYVRDDDGPVTPAHP